MTLYIVSWQNSCQSVKKNDEDLFFYKTMYWMLSVMGQIKTDLGFCAHQLELSIRKAKIMVSFIMIVTDQRTFT